MKRNLFLVMVIGFAVAALGFAGGQAEDGEPDALVLWRCGRRRRSRRVGCRLSGKASRDFR